MGYLLDGLRALGTTIKTVFRPEATQRFPKVVRPRPERYRASFALVHEENGDEACIGCLQCERICPSQVIKVKGPVKRESPITKKNRGYADDFQLDLSACIFCELCVQVCPADAIIMTHEPEIPAFGREDLVLTMAKLYANEKAKPRSWADGSKLMAMQAVPKPPAVAKPPAEAPAAAKAPAAAAPATNAPAAATSATGPTAPAAPAPGATSVPAAATSAASTTAPAAPAPAATNAPAAAATSPAPSAAAAVTNHPASGDGRPATPAPPARVADVSAKKAEP